MQIFLAPRSNETSYKNFLSTIENGVDYLIVEPHLDGTGRNLLKDSGKLFVWGNKESKKSSWDKMQNDDVILFYKGREGEEREGKLLYAGRLFYKQHSKNLGLSLWPPKSGEEPWTCIFFLKDLQPIYIPISEMADYAGYSRNYIVQGFQPVSEEGVNKILSKFGTIEKFLSYYSGHKDHGENDLEEQENLNAITAHSEAELYLLKIGRMLEYDTYTPDRSAEAFGEKLESYTSLKNIPTRFLGELTPIIREIDTIWFKDEKPQFAFEVEHTTKFGSGFQRLYQLNALSTKLFIVSASKNYPLFDKFINTDPYYKYKDGFYFRDYKKLEEYFRSVSQFEKINNTFLDGNI